MGAKMKLTGNKLKTSKAPTLSSVPKRPGKVKKKLKQVDPLKTIKDKLVGKNYSPTIEKAHNKLKQNSVVLSATTSKKSLPGKVLQTDSTKKQKKLKARTDPDDKKYKISPAPKKKNETEKIANVVLEPYTKKEKITTPKIVKKPLGSSTKEAETKKYNKDQTQSKVIKRKYKPEKPESPIKQEKKIKNEVKVENKSISSSVDLKQEDQPMVAKPKLLKVKKKSSTTKIKDLKPISNIKSLVKRKPLKKSLRVKNKLKTFPERGVCYFSHIPHGFYEKELKKYCSQFGTVTGVYHPVSKKGNSRGYAFVEFLHKEVAEVVAETMNNYLMFNRLLKCEYVPPESQKPWVFKQNRDNKKAASLRRRENLQLQMRNLTNDEVKKWKSRRLERVNSLHKKLAALGVDYEFQVNDTKVNEVKQEVKDLKE